MVALACSRQPPAPEAAQPPSREARSAEPGAHLPPPEPPDADEPADAMAVDASTADDDPMATHFMVQADLLHLVPLPPPADDRAAAHRDALLVVSRGAVGWTLQRRESRARSPRDFAREVPGRAQGRDDPDRRAARDLQRRGVHGARLLERRTRARRRCASISSSSPTCRASCRSSGARPRRRTRSAASKESGSARSRSGASRAPPTRRGRRRGTTPTATSSTSRSATRISRTRWAPTGRCGAATSTTRRRPGTPARPTPSPRARSRAAAPASACSTSTGTSPR